MRSHGGHPLIPTFEPSGLSLPFANKFDMMDHVLIGQLLSVSFMVPAGLTSVCFPSFSPLSHHISTDGLFNGLFPQNRFKYLLKRSMVSSYIEKFHNEPDKKFPEMYTVLQILQNLFKFSIVCLFHWDSHVLSLLSFVSFTLPPTVCPPDNAKGYSSS